MFETDDTARLSLFSGFGGHLWSYVRTHLQIPWLHVTCLVTDDGGDAFTQTFMLSDVIQLLEISRREDITLESVDLVSPKHVNGTSRWRMEPLRQIWRRAIGENGGWRGYVFVLESGTRYCYAGASPEDGVSAAELIFQI